MPERARTPRLGLFTLHRVCCIGVTALAGSLPFVNPVHGQLTEEEQAILLLVYGENQYLAEVFTAEEGNLRIAGYWSEMPIPSIDFDASKQPLERESGHGMLIDADSPASSKAAASLL